MFVAYAPNNPPALKVILRNYRVDPVSLDVNKD